MSHGCTRGSPCSMSLPGDDTGGATPVPIPNTEVKPSRADGTALATAWESRSPPGIHAKGASTAPFEHPRRQIAPAKPALDHARAQWLGRRVFQPTKAV